MTHGTNLQLLKKQMAILREELESKIGQDINNLSCPEVIEVNNKIDQLLIPYIKLTLGE